MQLVFSYQFVSPISRSFFFDAAWCDLRVSMANSNWVKDTEKNDGLNDGTVVVFPTSDGGIAY